MPQAMTPQEFVAKWRNVIVKERSGYQEHFMDVCRLVDYPTPLEADPTGRHYTFEAGAKKLGGKQGFADVWRRGLFAWEYKGKRADLDAAYRQLLQYREDLENPPLLIACDLDKVIIHPQFVNAANRPVTLTLDDLLTPDGMATLRAVFHDPERFHAAQTPAQVTEQAAKEFGRLAELLRAAGADPQEAAHFLIRLLFCLFAEDVNLLPHDLFTRLVQAARGRPDAFAAQLGQLFAAMSTGGWFGTEPIQHFDGRLFDDAQVLPLDAEGLEILANICGLNWAAMEPSILGTLFERSLDPDKRAQLGAHYTSREDILLIMEPVLMAPLRRRWAEVRVQAEALAAERDAAPTGQVSAAEKAKRTRFRDKCNADLARLLDGFADEIAAVQVLDPACGSGNFLYVALRQLLDLEHEVIRLAAALGLTRFTPRVDPAQLHGIEINEYAHELAQATIWIGYLQWLHEHGFGAPSAPVLRPLDNVLQMDAIMDRATDPPTEPAWPAADVIIGNPPFLGGGRMRKELGDAYTEALFRLYGDRLPNFSDLVCYWFEKARAYIEQGTVQRVGLLATQGIRGGANRKVLERIKESGDIFWAISDRDWILAGANVHVSMVGFDGGGEAVRELDGKSVTKINANLTALADTTQAQILPENGGLSFQGPSPKAPFDIPAELAERMLTAPMNPNGRFNSDVVRPVASAIDIARGSRGSWTIYFADMEMEEAAQYEMPFEHVRMNVLPVRANRRDDYRGQWWQYARPRPDMRRALNGLSRYIATPRVSKYRVFSWMPANHLANDGTIVFAREDDYFFGVLHSRVHEVWALRMGTALEDRPRYTPTTTFETFPFPWPPGAEPVGDPRAEAIAAAARELVQLRNAWLDPPGASDAELKKRTLTNLYNARPTWLDLAHRKLDEAVLDAYAWPHDVTDEELLARLLALNLARARIA